MDFTDPFLNTEETNGITGYEPVLGGQLAEKAVWVDEAKCIGCQYCVHVASNTFTVDEFHGRSRAIRQDGDSSDVIQEAISEIWSNQSEDPYFISGWYEISKKLGSIRFF